MHRIFCASLHSPPGKLFFSALGHAVTDDTAGNVSPQLTTDSVQVTQRSQRDEKKEKSPGRKFMSSQGREVKQAQRKGRGRQVAVEKEGGKGWGKRSQEINESSKREIQKRKVKAKQLAFQPYPYVQSFQHSLKIRFPL